MIDMDIEVRASPAMHAEEQKKFHAMSCPKRLGGLSASPYMTCPDTKSLARQRQKNCDKVERYTPPPRP